MIPIITSILSNDDHTKSQKLRIVTEKEVKRIIDDSSSENDNVTGRKISFLYSEIKSADL